MDFKHASRALAKHCWIGLALAIIPILSYANPLARPDSLQSNRAFLLPDCPRAAALTPASNFDSAPAERAWKTIGGGGPESAGTVFGAVAPVVIDGALDALQAWLDERAKAREITLEFTAIGYAAAQVHSSGVAAASLKQCLVLISGKFGPSEKVPAQPLKDKELEQGDWSKDWLSSMGLINAPEFYAEVNLIYSPEFGELRAAPAYIEYRESKLLSAGDKTRDLVLSLAFSRDGAAVGGTVLRIAQNLKPGTVLTPDLLSGQSTPWVPINHLLDPASRSERRLLISAFAIQASLIESSVPGDFDRLLARLLSATRPRLNALLDRVGTSGKGGSSAPKNE